MSESIGLAVGERAPEFTAPLVHPDGSVQETPIAEFLEEKPVLLCFYTNDFSPDCIDEWCEFRDFDWFNSTEQVQVVGISKSRVGTHRRFIDYLDLGFPLYSDTDLSVSELFGVKYRTLRILPRARRSCFLVDRNRRVRYKWIGIHPIDPTRDTPPVDEVHDAIRKELGTA